MRRRTPKYKRARQRVKAWLKQLGGSSWNSTGQRRSAGVVHTQTSTTPTSSPRA